MNQKFKHFTVPDICDAYESNISIGNVFLKSYGGLEKFYGEIVTAECEHSNSVVKEIVQEDGSNKVLVINHTDTDIDIFNNFNVSYVSIYKYAIPVIFICCLCNLISNHRT